VQRFISSAAHDPSVLAIKMTLYRTGDDSPFIPLLIRAAEAGKQVVCVVELKARFDEQRNVQVAHQLERAGVHVVYGMVGLKTHTKTALVVRRESDGVRCYAHIGTGNYHAGTARAYTDLGLFTADLAYTDDIVDLFHFLTGRSLNREYNRLLIAPVNMRARYLEMIEREVAHAIGGKPAHIVAKMNQLQDREIIRALYEASNAGVRVDLIVRGFCCLVPGVEGLSENIRVISIVGRFLEHSRIFYFRNGAENPVEGEFYMGSADWMYRNLENRVEANTPVEDRHAKERLWQILDVQLRDNRLAWEMNPDGTYTQVRASEGEEEINSQTALMDAAMSFRDRDREAIRKRFVPHAASSYSDDDD
jgi:polyphosphate kinase